MNKAWAFVRLDWMTVKSYFTVKNLVLSGAAVVFLTLMSGMASSGIAMGMMHATIFASYPFIMGEKSALDALYTTLSVDRKTVVAGRYLFTLLLNLAAAAFASALAAASTIASGILKINAALSDGGMSSAALAVLVVILVVIQAAQLPLFFRLGYTRARPFTFLPFVALLAGSFLLMREEGAAAVDGLAKAADNGYPAAVLLAAGLFLIVWLSFRLSVSFYEKRAF